MSYYTNGARGKLIDILFATTEVKETVLSPIELIEHLDLIINLTNEALAKLREEDKNGP